MVSYDIPVTGEELVQTDLPYSNIIFNDQEGVLYNPTVDGRVIGEFSKTFNPSLQKNFAWDNVKLNWTRSATATPTGGFKTSFILEGIFPTGQVDTIGETIITTINATPTTEDVLFPLKSSRSMSSFTKSNVATSTAGTVQVNLPKRWFYYDSVELNMVCPDGWTKIAPFTFEGPSTEVTGGQLKRIRIYYDSDMNSDFSDVRFMDSDCRRFLCFNIDSKSDGYYAYFTILIPTMPASPSLKTIYMVYGNSSATATTSSFTSEALGSDEPDIFQTTHLSDTFGDASIDTSIWTVSDPTSGTDVTESSGTLNVIVNSGVTTTNFTNVPIVYTPILGRDWQFKIRFTNTSLNGDVEGGLFLMNTRSNVKQFKFWRNGADNKYYFQGPTGTNTEVTGGAYWMRITYRGGTYSFEYSAGGTTWTTLYSTSSLGISPTHIGMYAHHWGANQPVTFTFDDFTLMKGLGNECDATTTEISPATPVEDDTVLIFTLPADWIDGIMSYLRVDEIYSTSYDTPDLPISDQDSAGLGFNSVDKYSAIRVRTLIEADNTCTISINSMNYGYEV
jgi:hypothetical protein